RGPGFPVEFDQGLKFAQDVAVAEGVEDREQAIVGRKMVVNGDAALQALGDRAALFPGAIERVTQARRGVQPLQLAGHAVTRFVEMANLRLGDALPDALVDRLQRFVLPAHPRPRRWPDRARARRTDRSA